MSISVELIIRGNSQSHEINFTKLKVVKERRFEQQSPKQIYVTFLRTFLKGTRLSATKFFLIAKILWSWGGSNSWPLACKASALPAELQPPEIVGPEGLEPSTPVLSGLCSNQLSYGPEIKCLPTVRQVCITACAMPWFITLKHEMSEAISQSWLRE